MLKQRQQRRIQALCAAGILLLLLTPAGALALRGYQLYGRIAGGGDTTGTGGSYALSGTIGQHEATGLRNGGTYSLSSGWWSQGNSNPTAVTLVRFAGRTVGAPAIAVPLAMGMLSALGLLLLRRHA